MIEAYLQGIDALLSASPLVRDVEVVRRTIRDTEFEKVLHYRYRVLLANGDFIEMTERVLEAQGRLGSCRATVRVMNRVFSQPVWLLSMALSAGLQ
jgi:hypothetical protein